MNVRLAAGTALALASCVSPEPSGPREPFIAVVSDFEGFEEWPSFELPPESLTAAHPDGTRRLYYSNVPNGPDEGFPIGTILVKATHDGEPVDWEIHAMVKRGDGYNAEGSREWEFLDLHYQDDGALIVRWRGEGPPPGMGYPGEGVGDGQCNACHALVPERDYVFDRVLWNDLL